MTGQEYWRKRFEALHEALLKDGEGSYADAEKIFAEARRSIEADLARWYMRLAKNNQVSLTEARKLLSKDELKEFHWTVEEYIKRGRENAATQQWMKELENASAKFHISRLEAIRIQMQQHLKELYGNYNDALDDTMRRLYSDGYYKTAYTLEQGFHTGFDVSRLNDKDIDTILARPWAADGKNFSTRIWGDKDRLMNTLQTELVQGLIRGDPLQKITKRFADKMGASQSNAKRLIYTESAYFASAGEYQGMKELGVEKYEYLATLDSRTSEICQDMDGKIFKLSEYMPGTTAPPLHVHCRSTTVPYYGKGGTLRAARDEKNKTVYVPDMPYKDWKSIFVDKTQTLEKWKKNHANSDVDLGKLPAIMKTWKRLPIGHGIEDDIKNTNPKYSTGREYKINCQRCVSAFEARQRGFDVTAKPAYGGHGDRMPYMFDKKNGWTSVYDNPKPILCASNSGSNVRKKVEYAILAMGDGARAIVRVQWQKRYGGGGHVFIAICDGNHVRFLDPQSGNLDVSHYFSCIKRDQTYVIRIDNLSFTDHIELCCEAKKK